MISKAVDQKSHSKCDCHDIVQTQEVVEMILVNRRQVINQKVNDKKHDYKDADVVLPVEGILVFGQVDNDDVRPIPENCQLDDQR